MFYGVQTEEAIDRALERLVFSYPIGKRKIYADDSIRIIRSLKDEDHNPAVILEIFRRLCKISITMQLIKEIWPPRTKMNVENRQILFSRLIKERDIEPQIAELAIRSSIGRGIRWDRNSNEQKNNDISPHASFLTEEILKQSLSEANAVQ